MGKMEICSDLEDQQISKLNEYSLVALRIRKAGRGARLGFGKFKCRKSNLGGNVGAKAHRPESTEPSSATNGSYEASAHDLRKSLPAPSSPSPESSANLRETNAGLVQTDPVALSESGNTQAPGRGVETTSARSSEESREGAPKTSFAAQAPKGPDAIRQGSRWRAGKLLTSSGTSKDPLYSLQFCQFFSNRLRERWGLGNSEQRRRKARSKREAPSHRREEELRRKLGSRKGIKHQQKRHTQPSSDYTRKQRTRKERPSRSRTPRPIAS
ncbi:unnamed protein product [Sphagnum tenellum]